MTSRTSSTDRRPLWARFVLGEPLAGPPRTDATFWRRGRRVLIEGNPRAWAYLAGWERAVTRVGLVLAGIAYAYALTRWGALAHAAVGVPTAALAGWRVRQYRRLGAERRHRRELVEPLEAVLRRYLDNLPRGAVEVPLSYADDPDTPAVITLPPTFAGKHDPQAELIRGIVLDRLGLDDDAVCSFRGKGGEPKLYVSVPPRPPRRVGLDDVRDAMLTAPDTRPVIGLGAGGRLVTADYEGESPHVLISAGSGGGKSVLVRSLTAQALHNGATVVMLDVKHLSHMWLRGLPGVLYCRSDEAIHNALLSLVGEATRRYSTAADTLDVRLDPNLDDVPDDNDIDVGPRVILVAEELNATVARLQTYWERVRPAGAKKTSPAVQALADILNMGRQARMNVLALAQYATANTTAGPAARENFGIRCLARASRNAFRMLAPQISPVPTSSTVPGRWHIVVSDQALETQVAFLSPREARGFARSGRQPAPVPGLSPYTAPSPDSSTSENDASVSPSGDYVTQSEAVREGLLVDPRSGVPAGREAVKKALQRAREAGEAPPSIDREGKVYYERQALRAWWENRPAARVTVEGEA